VKKDRFQLNKINRIKLEESNKINTCEVVVLRFHKSFRVGCGATPPQWRVHRASLRLKAARAANGPGGDAVMRSGNLGVPSHGPAARAHKFNGHVHV